jgi:hypothetical protein
MNIGVVCEGPTDFHAIEHFFKHALEGKNVTADFRALFPEMDKTRPDGGWANVLLWLKNNPANSRVKKYFGSGLFAGTLSTEPLDAIIIHLDTDILPNISFRNYVKQNYAYDVADADSPLSKAIQIKKVINLAAQFDVMTDADKTRHVPAPAVESTETWCVAAFTNTVINFEWLAGIQLTNSFMTALERSEGREPQANYADINKDRERRRRFCEKHKTGSTRIVDGCSQFAEILSELTSLNPS